MELLREKESMKGTSKARQESVGSGWRTSDGACAPGVKAAEIQILSESHTHWQ